MPPRRAFSPPESTWRKVLRRLFCCGSSHIEYVYFIFPSLTRLLTCLQTRARAVTKARARGPGVCTTPGAPSSSSRVGTSRGEPPRPNSAQARRIRITGMATITTTDPSNTRADATGILVGQVSDRGGEGSVCIWQAAREEDERLGLHLAGSLEGGKQGSVIHQ